MQCWLWLRAAKGLLFDSPPPPHTHPSNPCYIRGASLAANIPSKTFLMNFIALVRKLFNVHTSLSFRWSNNEKCNPKNLETHFILFANV